MSSSLTFYKICVSPWSMRLLHPLNPSFLSLSYLCLQSPRQPGPTSAPSSTMPILSTSRRSSLMATDRFTSTSFLCIWVIFSFSHATHKKQTVHPSFLIVNPLSPHRSYLVRVLPLTVLAGSSAPCPTSWTPSPSCTTPPPLASSPLSRNSCPPRGLRFQGFGFLKIVNLISISLFTETNTEQRLSTRLV